MFTGLVQAIGVVASLDRRPSAIRLTIDASGWKHRPSSGDSISVSGVCLTVAAPVRSTPRARRLLAFDVVQETLDKTALARLAPGSRVNLEHAATPTTLLGGHLVQGHVDGVGTVARVQRSDDWRLSIALPRPARAADPDLAHYVVPKGSICVDGVSLTIARLWSKPSARGFEVALIPTTLKLTTLAALKPGDPVNLETDLIAKTIVHYLAEFGPRTPARHPPTRHSRSK